jgi:hypothetical protein
MQNRETEKTLVTLANATELTRVIIQGVVGNDVADTIEGSSLTGDLINEITLARFQSSLKPFVTSPEATPNAVVA